MSILSAMTTLEMFDTLAGAAYITQLVFLPEKFMSENFKDGSTKGGQAMCRYAGVFLIGLRLQNYLIQSQAPEINKLASRNQGIVWGLCGVLTLVFWDRQKAPNSYVNVGLQAIFTAGFLWQAYGN